MAAAAADKEVEAAIEAPAMKAVKYKRAEAVDAEQRIARARAQFLQNVYFLRHSFLSSLTVGPSLLLE